MIISITHYPNRLNIIYIQTFEENSIITRQHNLLNSMRPKTHFFSRLPMHNFFLIWNNIDKMHHIQIKILIVAMQTTASQISKPSALPESQIFRTIFPDNFQIIVLYKFFLYTSSCNNLLFYCMFSKWGPRKTATRRGTTVHMSTVFVSYISFCY